MNNTTTNKIELTVIIPVTERFDPVSELFHEYKRGVEATGIEHEFIYVIDGEQPEALRELTELQKTEKFMIDTDQCIALILNMLEQV